MLPPLNNLFIQLLKSTALLSFVFVSEITRQATYMLISAFDPDAFPILALVLGCYLVLSLLITTGMRALERVAARRLGRGPAPRIRGREPATTSAGRPGGS